jgi:hypothetical protein
MAEQMFIHINIIESILVISVALMVWATIAYGMDPSVRNRAAFNLWAPMTVMLSIVYAMMRIWQ